MCSPIAIARRMRVSGIGLSVYSQLERMISRQDRAGSRGGDSRAAAREWLWARTEEKLERLEAKHYESFRMSSFAKNSAFWMI